jgi:hypothetical protein
VVQDPTLGHPDALEAAIEVIEHEHHVDGDDDEENTEVVGDLDTIGEDDNDNDNTTPNVEGSTVDGRQSKSANSTSKANPSKPTTAKKGKMTKVNSGCPNTLGVTAVPKDMAATVSMSPESAHGPSSDSRDGGSGDSGEDCASMRGGDAAGGDQHRANIRQVTGGDSGVRDEGDGLDFSMNDGWNMEIAGSHLQLVRVTEPLRCLCLLIVFDRKTSVC